jgi:SAM-dependent methyltransferase
MKKVLRYEDNISYWNRRWTETGRDSDRFEDTSIYHIKYAEMVMTDRALHALELGAGLGRLLKHYHFAGYDISGIERSIPAVERLRSENQSLKIFEADACQLPFPDKEFDVILALGLYHNLEHNLDQALCETSRCLKSGGLFCISMRPDNLAMNLNELLIKLKSIQMIGQKKHFHKWCTKKREFISFLSRYDLMTDTVYHASNFSIIYRLPFLRASAVNETEKRSKGYRLSRPGAILDKMLYGIFPAAFCNVLVFIGHRK